MKEENNLHSSMDRLETQHQDRYHVEAKHLHSSMDRLETRLCTLLFL